MTRLRTFDPLLDTRTLRSLTDPDEYREHSPLVLLLIAALAAFLVGLGWAAWTSEAGAGAGPRGDLSNRGGGMPVQGPVAAGTTGAPRGVPSLPVEAAEIPRAGGEESGGGSPGVGATQPASYVSNRERN